MRPRLPPKPFLSRAATRPDSIATRSSFLLRTRPGCRTSTRRPASILAWESILAEKVTLNLDPQQVKQAETQKTAADGAVTARLPETYQWLLVPVQTTPQSVIEWQAIRLSGQDALAVRASKKLKNDELLITSFAATRLRMELDRVPLWRGDHVAVKQLVEDFACYPYLPRLKDSSVLLGAVRDGLGLLTWQMDSFAYAESYDETAERYRGLRYAQVKSIAEGDTGLLVRPDVALKQINIEKTPAPGPEVPGGKSGDGEGTPPPGIGQGPSPQPPGRIEPPKPKRFHGSVPLDAARVGRDASRIAEEVISHLAGLVGSTVKVTLEIEAEIPSGAPDHVVRTVTENSLTLKFKDQGFETE